MTWFGYALLAIVLFSITNHIDKFLVSRQFKGSAPGSLILFSSLFGLVAMSFIGFFNHEVFSLTGAHLAALIGCGVLWTIGLIFYLYAVSMDEMSVVAPLWQMVPLIGYGLGYLFLGETLTGSQMVAGLIIISGALLISLDLEVLHRPRLKHRLVLFMFSACLLVAIAGIIFKAVALEESFWIASFWNYAGMSLVGITLFAFVKPYRKQFLATFRPNRISIFLANVFSELLGIAGGLLNSFATLLVPITLVWIVGGASPFFTFLFGTILTVFFPHIAVERLNRRVVLQKVAAIIIIFIGGYLLNISV